MEVLERGDRVQVSLRTRVVKGAVNGEEGAVVRMELRPEPYTVQLDSGGLVRFTRDELVKITPPPKKGKKAKKRVDVIAVVRQIADSEHPWIPGADADLIRDIADTLERQDEALKKIAQIAKPGYSAKALPSELLDEIQTVVKKAGKK